WIYNQARQILKQHVNAGPDDALVTTGSGMTGALMRLQEILGLKFKERRFEDPRKKPVVFITHMEHHSNQVSWQETCADVVIIPPGADNLVDPRKLEEVLHEYQDREVKIGAFTACSNVAGIITPYHELAAIMHRNNGLCVIDFAASAPYVSIDMHPDQEEQRLDAITFSPHKFLGGPGSCGILVFDKNLHNGKPCVPGGGNVKWTNPWGEFGYTSDVEVMEDGGTPGFMQAIRAALACVLKNEMGVTKMQEREKHLLRKAFEAVEEMEEVEVVGGTDLSIPRIGALAFNIRGFHYNLVVRLLNDYFGIQARGGWSCASTYSHYLFQMDSDSSLTLTNGISNNNLTGKPGWVRLSLHPTMTDKELDYCLHAIKEIIKNGSDWASAYTYDPSNNEYMPTENQPLSKTVEGVFELS
ncbi:MAG: aminotransferase class V-fold PLP-dependent enzyme, partial [Owenweeksia sp.]